VEQAQQVRVFVAVPTPERVKQAIAKAQSELREATSGMDIRWPKSEQFHLTLRFLGNVSVSGLDELKEGVRAACGEFAPLELTAAGIGFFPANRPPRVVWVGVVDDQGVLSSLWRAIESATQPFTGEKAEERFTGHITLARIGRLGRRETEPLVKAVERLQGTTFGEWTASKVELIRSELSPQGARHTVLEAVELGG